MARLATLLTIVAAVTLGSAEDSPTYDAFGILNLFGSPPRGTGGDWANTWDQGQRTIFNTPTHDPYDNRTFMKGSSSGADVVIQQGAALFEGSPRLYIEGRWEDVEMTGYGTYLAYGEIKSYSGLTMAARTNHGDYDVDGGCAAATYYAKIYTTTGEASFQKEYQHGMDGAVYSASDRVDVPVLASGIPLGLEIGMKFVVYTVDDADVQLELWLDFAGGTEGGDWQLAHSKRDTYGSWLAQSEIPPECGDDPLHVEQGETILGARDYCFLRTDGNLDTQVMWSRASVRRVSAERAASMAPTPTPTSTQALAPTTAPPGPVAPGPTLVDGARQAATGAVGMWAVWVLVGQ